MTLNEVVWRQACALKAKSDDFVRTMQKHDDARAMSYDIATQTAIVVCYASYATGDISPMQIYDDIMKQVSQLQTAIWQIYKTCEDSSLQEHAKKLYESCATLKKRLRKKIAAIEQLDAIVEETTQTIRNALEVTPALSCVATCT